MAFPTWLCLYALEKSTEQHCHSPQSTKRNVCFKTECNKTLMKATCEKNRVQSDFLYLINKWIKLDEFFYKAVKKKWC